MHPLNLISGRLGLLHVCVLALALRVLATTSAIAAFGLSTATDYYTVDTGAGLVFKVRRTDNGSSTQSAGDIMSLVYNGVEYQDQSRGSQINSGFDWLGYSTSAVSVSAEVVNTNYIKITVVAGDLTHYYMARKGYPHIYMATYFITEPVTGGALCRYIMRIQVAKLPNGPTPSDNRNTDGTIESGDIFGFSSANANTALIGQTRSKHYSGIRLKDWTYIGANNSATSPTAGMWIVRDNQEGSSGGPFYKSLLNQCTSTNQEITYIVNYGEGQTEDFRIGILNCYTLVLTNGVAPGAVDTSWFSGMGLTGYVGPSGRGTVTCAGISNRDTSYPYTVGFANSTAQYFTDASAADGSFTLAGMLPGTYTMRVYKNELSVHSVTAVTVSAGGTTTVNPIAITGDPSTTVPRWRIGNWDGTPLEFLYGDKITYMHPSDVRITGTIGTAAWNPGTYIIGTSTPATGMPCYQWKDVNGSLAVQFNLTSTSSCTVRIGITVAYEGARPRISVNSWTSSYSGPSTQPDSRTLTVGTYRGNNATFTFSVPVSALIAGTNTLYINPVSGSGASQYLSAGYSIDAIDMYQGSATSLAIPRPPTSLTGTASNAQVALSWTASTGATAYILARGTSTGGLYTQVAKVSGTSYTDTGLTNETTYYYVVSGSNSSGVGLSSSELSSTPTGAPPTPIGLVATSGNTQISLNWVATSGATSYNIKRSTSNGGPYTTIANTTATSFVNTGLVNSTAYYFVVSALNGGSESQNSAQVGATPAGPAQIAYLRFDESSGVTATDSTGNDWNGTLVNGPTWATGTNGRINNAVKLDGANDHVTLPAGVVSGLNDFTISAWVKLDSVSNWSRIFDFGTGTTSYMFLTPKNGTTSKVRFAITTSGGGGEQQIEGPAALTSGAWTHVAVTLSGSTGTLYVSGSSVGTNAAMSLRPSSLASTNLNYIGRSQFTSDPYLNGTVDEFQIYNRALSASEIAGLAAPPSAPTALVAIPGNNQITINWNAASGATGYNLKRAIASGGPYSIVATSLTGTNYTNTSLTNGTTYYYAVTTASGVAESANSSEASAKPGLYFSQWITAAFTGKSSPAIIGDSADPDGDGISNLVEFFEGTNPAASDTAPITSALDGLGNVVLTFRMAKNLIGVTYSIDQSPDLANWTITGLQGIPTDMGSYYSMKVTIPLGSNTKLFYRLTVTPSGS